MKSLAHSPVQLYRATDYNGGVDCGRFPSDNCAFAASLWMGIPGDPLGWGAGSLDEGAHVRWGSSFALRPDGGQD